MKKLLEEFSRQIFGTKKTHPKRNKDLERELYKLRMSQFEVKKAVEIAKYRAKRKGWF